MIKNLIHLDFKKLKLKNPTDNNWYVPNIQKQTDTEIMAFQVVEFSREGYKIRKVFG